MKTVILCGGFGTRIRDVSEDIPKPMIPIGGQPILWHIMKYYSQFGQREFILCLGYKSHIVKDYFINYRAHRNDFTISLSEPESIDFHQAGPIEDWRVTLADTGLHAMTGARVKRIKKYVGNDENFMLTYGDGVGNINIHELMSFHKNHGKILTVTGVRPPGRFGEMECSVDGMVKEFNEKPQSSGGLISGGFFVCRSEIFDYLNDSEDLVFEQAPMKKLVRDQQMMVFVHQGFWQPMDTARDHQLLSGLIEKGEAPWITW